MIDRAALKSCIEKGLFIFPVDTNKIPLCKWREVSTNDLDKAAAIFQKFPAAQIAADCEKSKLVAIDCDCKNGIDGISNFEHLVKESGIGTADAWISQTPSGGQHFIYKINGHGIPKNSAGKLAPGIDVRGYGGYIVVPPSEIKTGKYTALNDWSQPPGYLPDSLRILLDDQTESANNKKDHWLKKYLNEARPGNRNETCFKLAAQLRDDGNSYAEAERIIQDYADRVPKGKDPFTRAEAMATLKSAYSGTSRQPAEFGRVEIPFVNTPPAESGPAVAEKKQPPEVPTMPLEEDGWILYSMEDCFKERPPAEYLVNGLFRVPSLVEFFGPPGTLKSLLLADLAVCMAGGLPWLEPAPWSPGSEPKNTSQCSVLWLDLDNGNEDTKDRFKALTIGHGLPSSIPVYHYTMPNPWPKLANNDDRDALMSRIFRIGARVLVVDCLSKISSGIAENDAAMDAVMTSLRIISETLKILIIVIHHSNKDRGQNARTGDRSRGSGSIEANFNLSFYVDRSEGSDDVYLKPAKVRNNPVLPFAAQWTYEAAPDENKSLISGRFYGISGKGSNSDLELDNAIFKCSKDVWINKGNLTEAVISIMPGIGRDKIKNRIDYNKSKGKLSMKPGGIPNEKLFSLLSPNVS